MANIFHIYSPGFAATVDSLKVTDLMTVSLQGVFISDSDKDGLVHT